MFSARAASELIPLFVPGVGTLSSGELELQPRGLAFAAITATLMFVVTRGTRRGARVTRGAGFAACDGITDNRVGKGGVCTCDVCTCDVCICYVCKVDISILQATTAKDGTQEFIVLSPEEDTGRRRKEPHLSSSLFFVAGLRRNLSIGGEWKGTVVSFRIREQRDLGKDLVCGYTNIGTYTLFFLSLDSRKVRTS
jgi:hypothetical protein